MTAPLPSPRLSPTAGLFNAFVRHLTGRYRALEVELEARLAIVTAENQRLKGGVS